MAAPELVKSEQLWFSPEVIVLRVKTRLFRVPVSTLKSKSSVFANMFTLPRPPSADLETMDGAPVVDLPDDADEMNAFLKALFDPEFFHQVFTGPNLSSDLSVTGLAGLQNILYILRLSHKYDVHFLRKVALEHLETLYPLTSDDATSAPWKELDGSKCLELHLLTIQVATEAGALWLLPAAYNFAVCAASLRDTLVTPRWQELGEPQKMACILGHSEHPEHFLRALVGIVISPDCCIWGHQRLAMRLKLLEEPRDIFVLEDILSERDSVGIWCEKCSYLLDANYSRAKQDFWDRLPGTYNLPSWKELQAMRLSTLTGE